MTINRSPSLPPPSRPAKKKRGGQAGNHNARTHGLYSSDLTAEDITEFSQDVISRGIDPDIALIRARMRSVLLHAPSNHRALEDAAGALARMYSDKIGLGKANTRLLKHFLLALIESCILVADCQKNKCESKNEYAPAQKPYSGNFGSRSLATGREQNNAFPKNESQIAQRVFPVTLASWKSPPKQPLPRKTNEAGLIIE